MKRSLKKLFTILVFSALLVALCGCEQLGIGNAGNGIPQLGQAKVQTPAVGQEGVLRVGVDAANAPFSTLVNGKMVGIDVDVAAALASELGLKVDIVDVGADRDAALEAGTVDIVLGMDASDTSATCWLSQPYLETAVAIFATSSGAILPTADSKPSIEAQASSMSAWEITNQFGDSALKAVPDLKTVFVDLENGATTYGAADAVIGSYVSHTSAGNATIVGLMQKPSGYCVGVSAKNTELQTAVTDAVAALMEKGISGVIEAKWIGSSLNLGGISLTEAAAKADATSKDKDKDNNKDKKNSELGDVGTNAVDLKDDGSTPGASESEAGTNDTYWGWTTPTIDYTQQTTTDTTTETEVDTGTNQDTGYIAPVEPVEDVTQDTGVVDNSSSATDKGTAEIVEDYTDTGTEEA